MNKNLFIINLKKAALCTVLPLMMAACGGQKNNNVDAELADTKAKIESVEQKLNAKQQQRDSLLRDVISRDEKSIALSKTIKEYQQKKRTFSAPKDSLKAKACDRKIRTLLVDSIMNANKINQQILNSRDDEYSALLREQAMLQARRDSLMKVKSR